MGYLSNADLEFVARESYRLHLSGMDDSSIATQLKVDLEVVVQERTRYASKFSTPIESEARKSELASIDFDLAELEDYQSWLKTRRDELEVGKAVSAAVSIINQRASLRRDRRRMMGTDAPLKIEKTDGEMSKLVKEFYEHADSPDVADLPLD